MVECQLKGLFYNCDEKYFPRHKCKDKNLFMAISEDVDDVSPFKALPRPMILSHPMIQLSSNLSSICMLSLISQLPKPLS